MNTTMQIDVMPVNGSSVTQKALAAIVSSRKRVFREDRDTTPRSIGRYQYMPWGADDQMPYDILDLIEEDEVMTTCQQHVIRTCYGGGLHYETRPSDLLPGTGGEAGEKPASSPLPLRPSVLCRSSLPFSAVPPFRYLPLLPSVTPFRPFVPCRSVLFVICRRR